MTSVIFLHHFDCTVFLPCVLDINSLTAAKIGWRFDCVMNNEPNKTNKQATNQPTTKLLIYKYKDWFHFGYVAACCDRFLCLCVSSVQRFRSSSEYDLIVGAIGDRWNDVYSYCDRKTFERAIICAHACTHHARVSVCLCCRPISLIHHIHQIWCTRHTHWTHTTCIIR